MKTDSPRVRTSAKRLRINLGCGRAVMPGYVNVDIAPLAGVDLVHDLNRLPLPFESESAEEIICKDVLEHVDYIPLLRDIHRVLRPGGRVRIEVPHFTSSAMYGDPTHRNFFGYRVFQFFTRESPQPHYFDFAFEAIDLIHIHLPQRRAFFWNRWLEKWINGSSWARNLYEDSGLKYLFPADRIVAVLRK